MSQSFLRHSELRSPRANALTKDVEEGIAHCPSERDSGLTVHGV